MLKHIGFPIGIFIASISIDYFRGTTIDWSSKIIYVLLIWVIYSTYCFFKDRKKIDKFQFRTI